MKENSSMNDSLIQDILNKILQDLDYKTLIRYTLTSTQSQKIIEHFLTFLDNQQVIKYLKAIDNEIHRSTYFHTALNEFKKLKHVKRYRKSAKTDVVIKSGKNQQVSFEMGVKELPGYSVAITQITFMKNKLEQVGIETKEIEYQKIKKFYDSCSNAATVIVVLLACYEQYQAIKKDNLYHFCRFIAAFLLMVCLSAWIAFRQHYSILNTMLKNIKEIEEKYMSYELKDLVVKLTSADNVLQLVPHRNKLYNYYSPKFFQENNDYVKPWPKMIDRALKDIQKHLPIKIDDFGARDFVDQELNPSTLSFQKP